MLYPLSYHRIGSWNGGASYYHVDAPPFSIRYR